MRVRAAFGAAFLLFTGPLASGPTSAQGFGLAENSLDRFPAVRYENSYTVVPTTGKLVSIKITDQGTTYYICKEKTGYVIYHLDIRSAPDFKSKIREEMKRLEARWERRSPQELLFTKERYEAELERLKNKYSEAVWVRNEIVIGPPKKSLRSKR